MPAVLTPSATGVTQNELVRRIRMLLEDRPAQDVTTASIGASDTSLSITDSTMWDTGIWFEWDDGTGDQAIIGGTSGTTLSPLRRSAWGTTATSHASGVYLLREPRFGYTQITDALNQVVGWFTGVVWARATTTLTPSTTTNFYSVPSDFLGWIQVTQLSTNNLDQTEYGVPRSGRPVLIKRGVDSTLSSTGTALWLPFLDNTTKSVDLTYGRAVTLSTITEGSMAAAAVYGACSLLLGAKDVPRTGSDVSMGDTTAPPGSTLRTSQWFQAQYAQYVRNSRIELIRSGRLHR